MFQRFERKKLIHIIIVLFLSTVCFIATAEAASASTDIEIFQSCFFQSVTGDCVKADFNNDGAIDYIDFGLFGSASKYDLNGDEVVNLGNNKNYPSDLDVFYSCYGKPATGDCIKSDFNNDGIVTFSDYGLLLNNTAMTYDLNGDGIVDWQEWPDLTITNVNYSTLEQTIENIDYTVVNFNVKYKNIGKNNVTMPFYITGKSENTSDYPNGIAGGRIIEGANLPVAVNTEYESFSVISYSLTKGSSLNTTFTFYIDRFIPFGSAEDNKIIESNEDNNTYSKIVTIAGTENKPDLTITDIESKIEVGALAANNMPQTKYIYRVKYKNIGSGNVKKGFNITLSDSLSHLTKTAVIPITTEINSNEERYVDILFIDTSSKYQKFNFNAEIDTEYTIDETNENNNVFLKSMDVIIYDWELSDLKLNKEINYDNEDLFFQYRISNNSKGGQLPEYRVDLYWDGKLIKQLAYWSVSQALGIGKYDNYQGKLDGSYVKSGNHELKLVLVINGSDDTDNNILTKTITIGNNNDNSAMQISNIQATDISKDSFNIKWQTNGNYDCTMIYSLKDGNLDDDFLISTRDQDDHIFGSNFPQSNSGGTYYYHLQVKNQGDDVIYFKGEKAYYELICYDSNRNKKISSVYSFNLKKSEEEKPREPKEPTGTTTTTVLQLQRKITELEKQVIELEKKLTILDNKFAAKYSGTMFLDVENKGRLWYVDPASKNRFYFENGQAAISIGSKLATGISYEDIQKIPVGVPDKLYNLKDTDSDGLPDRLESALGSDPNKADSDSDGFNDKQELINGYNPTNNQKFDYSDSLIKRLEGKMLLQVAGPNSHGEIWYIHKGQRWYGGTEDSMYEIMKARSLGATAENIRKIEVGGIEGVK